MAAFKEELSPAAVAALADELARAWPSFPRERFVAHATDGLEALELKGRAGLIAGALVRSLPDDVDELERLVGRALASPGFAGWPLWAFLDAVTALTLAEPERGLPLLRRLTPRWTAEGAIRPFVAEHPEVAFRHLAAWVDDPDEHVRRLVSEGTRPRLPWSARLRALAADPTPTLPLLACLRDDPSEYVRRSVANHLNDIAKDHPELAVAVAADWLAAGGEHVDRVVRHALRDLVKRGHPGALALVGIDVDAAIDLLDLRAEPASLGIGGSTVVSCTLVARGEGPVAAEIDLRVHYANAGGAWTRRKTFKFARRTLVPGQPATVERAVPFRPVSIRQLHPGPHLVELQVNGRVVGSLEVELVAVADR